MRKFGIIFAVSLLAVACYKSKSDKPETEGGSETIELSSSIIKADSISGFSLAGSAQAHEASVNCPWWSSSHSFDFSSGEPVSIYRDGQDLSSGFSSCMVTLEEFSMGGLIYKRNSTPIVPLLLAAFEAFDDDDNVIDSKYVLFFRQPFLSPDACSTPEDNCNYYTVEFIYSELADADVFLENNVVINQVNLEMDEQPAPSCDVAAKWNLSGPLTAKPRLDITLSNCENTINTGFIRYGLIYKDGGEADPFLISDAFDVINGGDVTGDFPAPAGHIISLSLDEVKAIVGGDDVAALNANFILAIKNLLGISAAYYHIDN